MKEDILRRIFVSVLYASLLLLGPALAQAEKSSADNGWDFAVAAYLWGADIGGSTGSGADIDVSFNDLLDGLNAGFMGNLEARKDEWLILTDLVYLDVSADDTTNVTIPVGPGLGPGPIPIDVTAKTEIDLKGTVFQLAGGYRKGR